MSEIPPLYIPAVNQMLIEYQQVRRYFHHVWQFDEFKDAKLTSQKTDISVGKTL